MSIGFVSLVGAGPGDPELITVKGLRRLRAANVVIYDALANEALLRECRADAELIYAGKRAGQHYRSQDEINTLLVEKARAGLQVVRLKGGDPFVLGRGGEEAAVLAAAGIAWEVVPGISSAIAVPAYAGIPVTHRAAASSFAVITGHEDPDREATRLRWQTLAQGIDTLFAEITELASACKFRDCSHQHEPGCAVLAAVAAGTLDRVRLARWSKLQAESRSEGRR